MVQRASTDALAAAEQTHSASGDGEDASDEVAREEEALRRRIEDSRFDRGKEGQ